MLDINHTCAHVSENEASVLHLLWRGRKAIGQAMVVGAVVAATVALLLPPKYESTLRLMPPENQALSARTLLATNIPDERIASAANDALGVKTPGAVFMGVLRSRTIADRLIDGFDLMKVYGVKLRKNARQRLADHTDIAEDKKSGIITLTVLDRSPQRAAELAGAYVQQLDSRLAELNTSAAHRERLFLEQRLAKVREELAAATARLSRFSSGSSAVDPKEQGKALFDAAGRLQSQLSAAEAEIRSLEQIYTPNNVRVRAAQARATELKRQLGLLHDGGSARSALPSITRLPVLGATYADLLREVKVQESVYETLTKQYELAKVQEARELPSVRALDEPDVPERRVSPQRTLMTLAGLLLGAVFACVYIVVHAAWQRLAPAHPARGLALEVHDGLTADLKAWREHIARKHR